MEPISLCPLSAATIVWQSQAAQWKTTVCVKATFEVRPGGALVQRQQYDPHGDVFFGDRSDGPLYAASDLVPFKERCDIMLVATAHAPSSTPVDHVDVSLRLGDMLDKTLRVGGERHFERTSTGLRPSPAKPFVSMPLHTPEEQSMPVEGAPIPNVTVVEPSGAAPMFGPITPRARAEQHRLSPAALKWVRELPRPQGPAPEDLPFAYFNAAPRDQQRLVVPAGVELSIENVHPQFPRLVTRTPLVSPAVFRQLGGELTEIGVRCDTLWIDADRLLGVMVWRGTTDAAGPMIADQGVIYVMEGIDTDDRLAAAAARIEAHDSAHANSSAPRDRTQLRIDAPQKAARLLTPPSMRAAMPVSEDSDTMNLSAMDLSSLRGPSIDQPPISALYANAPGELSEDSDTMYLMNAPRSQPLPFAGNAEPPPSSVPASEQEGPRPRRMTVDVHPAQLEKKVTPLRLAEACRGIRQRCVARKRRVARGQRVARKRRIA